MTEPLDLLSALVLEDGRLWGEAAAPFQLEDAQAIFRDGGPRWHYLTRPRGGSKTTDLAGVALAWLSSEAPPGARGYVIASDKDQAALLVDAAAGLVSRTPALRGVVDVQAYKLIGRSGASVEVLAADGASAFGLRPLLLVCDEFAQWGETRNAKRVWSAILSSAGKVKGCRLVILTSAGEPSHWSHEILVHARKAPKRWHVHETPGPLPWIDPAELDAQRPLLRDSEFARLHLNVWTQAEDRLVSPEDLEAAAVLDGPLEPRQGVHYLVTADLGTTNDASVVCVSHAERMSDEAGAPRRVVVDRIGRWHGSRRQAVDLSEVEQWIEQTSRTYNGAVVHADPWQAVGLLQRLRQRGIPAHEFVFSSTSVGRVGQALHLALRNRLLHLPKDRELLDELGRVRLRETQPGVVRLDHDSSGHDDHAVAIGIAVALLLERPAGSELDRYLAYLEADEKGRPAEQSLRDAEVERQADEEERAAAFAALGIGTVQDNSPRNRPIREPMVGGSLSDYFGI